MREVQIAKWCDACRLEHEAAEDLPADVRVVATESWSIGIASGESIRPVPKVLDLCEAHGKAIQDLVLLLGHVNQLPEYAKTMPVQPKPRVSRPGRPDRECPVCRDLFGVSALTKHVWEVHRGENRPREPQSCPECGERFVNGTGMAAHRRATHGYDSLAEALAGVKGFKMPKPPRRAAQPTLDEVESS